MKIENGYAQYKMSLLHKNKNNALNKINQYLQNFNEKLVLRTMI